MVWARKRSRTREHRSVCAYDGILRDGRWGHLRNSLGLPLKLDGWPRAASLVKLRSSRFGGDE